MKFAVPFLLAASVQAASVQGNSPLCPIDTPISCSTTTFDDSCCFESPGGVILQTQFWDYDPATGPSDSFTLHGLWPDNCDGTYHQFCNDLLNIEAANIKTIIGSEFNDQALLSKMETFWKNYDGPDTLLWEHEFNKHGTCINTNSPACYGSNFKKDENVYNYYRIAFNLFEKYPTYQFLTDAGIVPSNEQTYTFDQISEALSSNFDGHSVYFNCDHENALQEVWYFHHMQGPLISESFVKIDSLTQSGCSRTGIKFIPKT
ncbi:ribonuclease T2 [Metschnikowia bicuspidata var. bicuspidata NRRL YB-4993]|uniref:ribonuclease T2 n=1 Tax=Metschnikowia bicuspidata var. bicuspidata NRRL YB-4993 TaxID=869754 RepID=A0A1A0H7F6_9ASCO|nr:ribonuclease T2 [Metschnikowia bicuspidata var. bicuspidata NRRL YB-4993]OBA19833.1 ribonuclease T2 [Metschnikowia bicuspidata var. bicuspidata NRRL YB-4993]